MSRSSTFRKELTFKENLHRGRHGWLRLTPAYSVKLVNEILNEEPHARLVLDPFCGTGTTGLVCGERGINCDLLDINPFLVWFARVKTTTYSREQLDEATTCLYTVVQQAQGDEQTDLWKPPISNIDRWWPEDIQILLSRLRVAIASAATTVASDLLQVAFCQKVIEWSNAAFNHQSMSFKDEPLRTKSLWHSEAHLLDEYMDAALRIIKTAQQPVIGTLNVVNADARSVPHPSRGLYDCVITSPPYPNRMSYIRELRPYMYWLKFLHEPRDAAELDWQAIGGTWGTATSRVAKWQPKGDVVPYLEFVNLIQQIAFSSQLLANYVHKYFVDISKHIDSLYPHLAHGARVYYVVGNSKFYDTLVPVEEIYASLFASAGFINTQVKRLRKRNSKKELYEYVVIAQKP